MLGTMQRECTPPENSKSVWGLAEMEFIFPPAVLTVLGCVLVTGKALVTHWYVGSAEHEGSLFNIFPSAAGWGWARLWEGSQPRQLTQTDQMDIPYYMMSAQQ